MAEYRPSVVMDLRDSPWLDGPGRTIQECARSIPEPFHIIVGSLVPDTRNDTPYTRSARRSGLDVCTFLDPGGFSFPLVRALVGEIRRRGSSIVHSHEFRSDVYGWLAARLVDIPFVSTTHGWITNDRKASLYKRFDLALLRRADHVIAVSECLRQQLIGFNVRQDRITVMPNTIRLDYFTPTREDRSFRKRLGIADSVVLISNIGRLSPEKGQELLLQALARLNDRSWHMVFCGIGPREAQLKNAAADYSIAERVTFAGFLDDMRPVYNSSDLVVQSSFTEGMPNIILEALAMQVPVLATDVGGTAEVLRHGQDGMLVRPNSVEALITGIAWTIDHRQKALGMAHAARARIENCFNSRTRPKRLAQVYRRILSDCG